MGKLKQKIALTIVGMADIKFHTNLPKWFRTIEAMESWSPSQILQWQTSKMQELVKHTYEHSVYYRELFDSCGLKPSDFKAIEDLEKIPPLTKDIIRSRFNDILVDDKSRFRYKNASSGGTSGEPLRYIKDNNSWGFTNAFQITQWNKIGYYYSDKYLALGAASLFPKNKKSLLHSLFYGLKGKVLFNAMNVSEEKLGECVELIKLKKIRYVYGFASSLYMLAKYILEHNLQEQIDVKACFPTSELLTEVYYEAISKAFRCNIMNSYGSNDAGIFGFKLNKEPGFKISYNCIVQTKPISGSDYGNALVTDLMSGVFPILRYDFGDVVKVGAGYNDYHNGQVLDEVIGRKSDIIELENGRVLTCPGFVHMFKDLNVKGYRMYKLSPMEISFDLVVSDGFSKKEEELIIATVKKHAGDDCNVVVNYHNCLSKRENGKMFYYEQY